MLPARGAGSRTGGEAPAWEGEPPAWEGEAPAEPNMSWARDDRNVRPGRARLAGGSPSQFNPGLEWVSGGPASGGPQFNERVAVEAARSAALPPETIMHDTPARRRLALPGKRCILMN